MDEFTLNKIIAVMDNFGLRLKAMEDRILGDPASTSSTQMGLLHEEIRSLNSQIVIVRGRLEALEAKQTEPESAVANPAKKRGWPRRG